MKATVNRTYALDEIIDAYTYVESGQKVGNVVINNMWNIFSVQLIRVFRKRFHSSNCCFNNASSSGNTAKSL